MIKEAPHILEPIHLLIPHLPTIPLDTLPLATREGALMFSIPVAVLAILALLSFTAKTIRNHTRNHHK